MNNRLSILGILLTLILTLSLSSCNLIEPNLTDEQVALEVNKVSEQIDLRPDWLSFDEEFSSEIIPSSSKELKYLDKGCRNNPNWCFEQCKNEDGNACYSLALLFEVNKGLEQNFTRPLFLRSCKFGIISGCTNYAAGVLNSDPQNIEINQTAKRIFEQTCEKKDAWGCAMYGMFLRELAENNEDLKNAIKYLNKACEFRSNEDEACKNAQTIIEQINKSRKKPKTKEEPKK